MPIYEYRCKKCEHEWEEMRKMSDTAPVKCAKCASKMTEKLLSRTSFQLKGSGWFKDGY